MTDDEALSPERVREALLLAMKHNAEMLEEMNREKAKRRVAYQLLRKAYAQLSVDRVGRCRVWMARCGRVLVADGTKPIKAWRGET